MAKRKGEPVPESPEVGSDVATPEGFGLSLDRLRECALAIEGSPVSGIVLRDREPGDRPGAGGWYQRSTRQIVVIRHESRAHEFHVLVHEVAHALLHGDGDHHSSPEREVEAESVSYVVCKVLGLDCSSYAFPYVAGWASGEKAHEAVLRSGERITKAARTVLDALLGDADAGPDSGEEVE